MKRTASHHRRVWIYPAIWFSCAAVIAMVGLIEIQASNQQMPPTYYFVCSAFIALLGILTVFLPKLRIYLQRQHYLTAQTPVEDDIHPADLLEAQFNELMISLKNALQKTEIITDFKPLHQCPIFKSIGNQQLALIPICAKTSEEINGQSVWVEGFTAVQLSGANWLPIPIFLPGNEHEALEYLAALCERNGKE